MTETREWKSTGGRGVLLVVAASSEAEAICHACGVAPPTRDWQVVPVAQGAELVRSGVGKVNGALAVARCVDPSRHGLVLSMGVGGAYGADGYRRLLQVVVATASVYADEGIARSGGFTTIARAGFPPGGSLEGERAFTGMGVADGGVAEELARRLEQAGCPVEHGAVLTVSTCSGTDELAAAYATRHQGAIAEGMEGAAVGHAVARLFAGNVRFGEIRVISNTTGDRDKQVWKLREALAVLGDTAKRLIQASASPGQ